MPEFQIHTAESAPAASRPLLQGLQEQAGFLPNLAATMAESPTLLEAFLSLRSIAARGSLDAVAREAVAIAVAFETRCTYCVAAHSTFALRQGAPPAAVEALRAGETPSDPRLRALTRFARAVAGRRDDVGDRAQQLLDAGFERAQLLEVLAVIAVPMLAGTVHHVAPVGLDAAFQPQACPHGLIDQWNREEART